MISAQKDINILQSINQVDNLKSKMLVRIACLYEGMTPGNPDYDELADLLGDIIMYTFLLGKKIGFDYDSIREEICHKLRLLQINEVNDISPEDLSKLSNYLGA